MIVLLLNLFCVTKERFYIACRWVIRIIQSLRLFQSSLNSGIIWNVRTKCWDPSRGQGLTQASLKVATRDIVPLSGRISFENLSEPWVWLRAAGRGLGVGTRIRI
jgi:hypothetical protein